MKNKRVILLENIPLGMSGRPNILLFTLPLCVHSNSIRLLKGLRWPPNFYFISSYFGGAFDHFEIAIKGWHSSKNG